MAPDPAALEQYLAQWKAAGVELARHTDGAWFTVLGGQKNPVAPDNAATFEAALAELQVSLAARQQQRQQRSRRAAPPSPVVPLVPATPAGTPLTAQSPLPAPALPAGQSLTARSPAFRFADDPTGATLAPQFQFAPDYTATPAGTSAVSVQSTQPAQPWQDDAPLHYPGGGIGAAVQPFRFADDPRDDVPTAPPAPAPASAPLPARPTATLADVQAQRRGHATVRQAAGGADVRRHPDTGGWQVRSGNTWADLAAPDAARLDAAHQRAVSPIVGQRAGMAATGAARGTLATGRRVAGQVADTLGPLLPAAGALAVLGGVHAAGSEGEHAARAWLEGAGSLTTDAMRAGQRMGQTVLGALLEPFGESGRAIAELTGKVGDTVIDAVGGAFKLLGNVAGAAGRLGGAAIGLGLGVGGALAGGAAGAGLGALGGGLAAVPGAVTTAAAGTLATGGIGTAAAVGAGGLQIAGGALAGGLTGLLPGAMIGAVIGVAAGAIALKLVEAVSDAVGGLLAAGGAALGTLGELATSAFSSALTIAKDLAATAERVGRDIAAIRAQTGLSPQRAGAFLGAFGALGLGGQAVGLAGPQQNAPALYAMRAGLYGLPSYENPDFLPRTAARYQQLQGQGFMGQFVARQMAGQLGMDSSESLRVLQMRPGQIREQIQFRQRIAGDVGLDAGKIKEVSDAFYLLENRAGSLVDTFKLRLVQEALPYAEKALSWLSEHVGQISGWIQRGLRWAIEDMPPLIMRAGATGLEAVGALAAGIGHMAGSILDNLPAIVAGADVFINAVRDVVASLYGAGAAIVRIAQNLGLNVPQLPGVEAQQGQTQAQRAGTQADGAEWQAAGDTASAQRAGRVVDAEGATVRDVYPKRTGASAGARALGQAIPELPTAAAGLPPWLDPFKGDRDTMRHLGGEQAQRDLEEYQRTGKRPGGLRGLAMRAGQFVGGIDRAFEGTPQTFAAGQQALYQQWKPSNLAGRYGDPNDPNNPVAKFWAAVKSGGADAEKYVAGHAHGLRDRADAYEAYFAKQGKEGGAAPADARQSALEERNELLRQIRDSLHSIERNPLKLATVGAVQRAMVQDEALGIISSQGLTGGP